MGEWVEGTGDGGLGIGAMGVEKRMGKGRWGVEERRNNGREG